MLAIPMVFGLAAGGARSGTAWLVPIATIGVFLAHHAIVPCLLRARAGKTSPPGFVARRLGWGVAYLLAAAAVFASALWAAPPPARGPFLAVACTAAGLAAVYVAASILGRARSIGFEALGLAGVSLSAPMMAVAAGQPLDRSLLGAPAIALGYFLSSVAFVRAYERMRHDRAAAIRACVVAHLALALILAGAAVSAMLPGYWWIAFVPVILRTAWGLISPPSSLRTLGMRELAVALAFTVLASTVLAYRV
jgi:hypothetical protein